MSLKDLAARTAGVAAREVERAPEREARTAPVRTYDLTQRLHAAEGEVEALKAKLEEERAANAARAAAGDQTAEEMLPVSLIDDSPYQSRLKLKRSRVEAVGASMKLTGQVSPITVRKKADGRYELIKGHTRKYGAINEGITELRALVVVRSDLEAVIDLWLDNTGDENTEYEFALMYRDAIDQGIAKTQKDIGKLFTHSQGAVSKRLKMLKLPEPVQGKLRETPDLFGSETADVVMDLWESHPAHHDIILRGLDRLVVDERDEETEGMEQSNKPKPMQQNALKPWVMQQISLVTKKEANKGSRGDDNHYIPHAGGANAFVTIPKGRDLVLRLADKALDYDQTRKAVEEFLTKYVMERDVAKAN
jgi:ParB family transcriptional regulator, chromosome partitioning protein